MAKITFFDGNPKRFHSKTVCRSGIAALLLVLSTFSAYAQQTLLSGKILDERTKAAVLGANIRIKGETGGSSTDENGNFSVKVKSLPITLLITSIDYKNQELDVYEAAPTTIYLTEDVNRLSSVVVVGYGTQKRSDVTGSVSSVSTNLLSQPTSSFDNLLHGSVSGVVATQSSSAPGSTTSIRIRGGNSINYGNDPLYVIDGFLVYNNNDYVNTGAVKGGSINALSTINPSDIESIDILKDASATAIYGARGANGVVIITTKKGKKGKDQVNYSGYVGKQVVANKIKLLNVEQWDQLENDIYSSVAPASRTGLNHFSEEDIAAEGNGSDWQSAALRNGIIQNHDLSITGGDEKSRYLISGNYFNQQGVVLNSDFVRYSGRLNYEREVSKKFKVSTNVFGSHSVENSLSGGDYNSNNFSSAFSSLIMTSPRTPIYNADGSYNTETKSYQTYETNPLNDVASVTNQTKLSRVLANFAGEYKLLNDLTLKVSGGADLTFTKQNYYAPASTSAGIATNGVAAVGATQVVSWLNENTLNYDHTFNDTHSLNILAGYTTQQQSGESAVANAKTFPNDLSTYNNLASGTALTATSSSFTKTLNSFLGRVSYSYLHKYNISLSERADGASVLGENNKWGYFSSVGLSWNVSKEEFLKQFDKTLNDFKIRLSAGQTGNSEVPAYSSLQSLSMSNYYFNNTLVTGLAPSQLANPNLAWETTTQYDAGVDFGLFNNRINVVFDAYYKKTSDLLLNVPLPLYTGYQSALENVGSVENKGFELTVNTDNIKTKNFSWKSTFVYATNANKILSLGNGVKSYFPLAPKAQVSPVIVAVGQPVGTFWGYTTNGLLTAEDIANGYPLLTGVSQIVGDQKYVPKTSTQKSISTADKHYLGSAQPLFTGSISNTLSYKQFDLSFLFQGSYGNKIFNLLQQQLEVPTESSNASATLLNRFSETNPKGSLPRATNSPVPQVVDRYIEDGSYLRLKSLTLSYSLPTGFVTKLGIKQFKIYTTGQNLLTFTKYTGLDPEANYYSDNTKQGIDYGVYPSSRTYLVGANITF